MRENSYQGKRYIALARCSSAGQIDTSIDEQLKLIEQFGRAHKMVHVETITLGGVTGSVPGARSDIAELIRRKKECDDYEFVVVQDTTRLTRSGPAHGMHILFELRSVGVDVISVKDDLPDGDMGDVMRTMQYFAAKQQADSIAFASTNGQSASLCQGKMAHCKAPPYGTDRLYLSEDGSPKHVIRNLSDGTQVKLHPKTGEIMERFGVNEASGVPAHYIKQKTEKIQLVPGDPERVRIVHEIFERHFRDGWGYYRIAQHLNERGVVAPRAGQWSLATVRGILFNPIYLGTGMANVATTGIYYRRGAEGPVPAATELKDLANGRPPRRIRPRSEWMERTEPKLRDLLDPLLQTAARTKQSLRLDALASRTPQPRNRDRHRDSGYILKGILTAKQGGYSLTGRTTGKPTCRKRYYAVSRAFSHPTNDRSLRTLVPAEPLEAVVVAALTEVLLNCEQVSAVIRQIVEREQHANHPAADLADLQKEKTAIEQKLAFVLDELSMESRDAVRAKVRQMEGRLKELKQEILRHSRKQRRAASPEEIADAVCGQLRDLALQLPTLPPQSVRELLQVFVSRLTVDLETKEVEVTFALPDWAADETDRLCLVGNPACKTANEAHPMVLRRSRFCYANRQYGRCSRAA